MNTQSPIVDSESKPIKTLDELLLWNPSISSSQPQRLSRKLVVPLAIHKPSTERSKTLLCHDMRDGYLDDRFDNGSDDHSAYRFFHWSYIDLFVYFSHNLVTIPPITWINAGHINGVPVLGTLIAEWSHGTEIFSKILQSAETSNEVIQQLIKITQYYQFNGWLINIECDIPPNLVTNLITFVKELTESLHKACDNSVVIWYDSVISPCGRVKYQYELNPLNQCFFDVCDGIFLDYKWNEKNLKASYNLSKSKKSEKSKFRNFDVYVGIDVFGRECRGKMDTYLPVNEILKYNLSIAIFAPGWTYEELGSANFTENEYLFWEKLNSLPKHIPIKLPIITTFCQGFGKRFYKNGEIISDKPWYNLNKQPINHNGIRICVEDAYNGGGSLIMKEPSVCLFNCEINLEKCVYSLTYKLTDKDTDLQNINSVLIYTSLNNTQEQSISLFHDRDTKSKELQITHLKNLCDSTREKIKKNDSNLLDESHPNGWYTDTFVIKKLHSSQVTLKSIIINTLETETSKLSGPMIGQLKIFETN